MASESPSASYEQVEFLNRQPVPSSSPVCLSTRLCVGVLILSMLCNAVLTAFIIHKILHSENSPAHPEHKLGNVDVSGAICVSCDSFNVPDLATEPFLTKVKVSELGEGTSLCCQKHSEGLTALINLLAGQYYNYGQGDYITNTEDSRISNTPGAHLYLDTSNIIGQRLLWDSRSGFGTAHTTGGVTYSNGSIRVPRDGVYNVYSFLTVQTDDVTDVDLNLVHTVNKFSPEHDNKQLLLINKLSLERKRGRFTTSFLAANLKLRKSDHLFVEFSHAPMVYKFCPANYFGVYLL